MKTRTKTGIAIKSMLIVAGLNAAGCNNAELLSKQCSLNYQEDLARHAEKVANGEATDEGEPRECELPTQEPGANLDVSIVMRNFNETQEAKMLDAVERIKLVVNSIEFKERVIGHTHNGKRTFFENNGLTNEEIYEQIMEAAETLIPEVDNEMDIDVTMYYKRSSTVGYTYPDTTRTWVNSRFFNGYTAGQVAANSVHEWTHKIGFGHSYYNSSDRPYTVPYAIGGIIEELIDSM